ncbi:Uncharacterised protein [Mycobacteroides abscessus subsp. abscessus]|nr:Uncharacterised protein [Mycobacteroides abscessus subsp. abscessus]
MDALETHKNSEYEMWTNASSEVSPFSAALTPYWRVAETDRDCWVRPDRAAGCPPRLRSCVRVAMSASWTRRDCADAGAGLVFGFQDRTFGCTSSPVQFHQIPPPKLPT